MPESACSHQIEFVGMPVTDATALQTLVRFCLSPLDQLSAGHLLVGKEMVSHTCGM